MIKHFGQPNHKETRGFLPCSKLILIWTARKRGSMLCVLSGGHCVPYLGSVSLRLTGLVHLFSEPSVALPEDHIQYNNCIVIDGRGHLTWFPMAGDSATVTCYSLCSIILNMSVVQFCSNLNFKHIKNYGTKEIFIY
jgi:hypothetical protein